MLWLLVVACLIVMLLLYVFVVRPAIRELPAFDPFFDWIEPYERALWAKSRTILVGRLYWLGGLMLGMHESIALIVPDWTPVFAWALSMLHGLPPELQPIVLGLAMAACTSFTGWLINKLRKVTSEPLADKE